MITRQNRVPGSFRDPSGFVFFAEGAVYRQVNRQYQENYDFFVDSGLYDKLVADGLLIAHKEVNPEYALTDDVYKVIEPEPIPFISYPYEWCFSQFKHAALLTLNIQLQALDFGMSLKDCSAYNIQFQNGKPVFIDTLSFEKYREGQPWVAYRQFCQHFLVPLVLMSQIDVRLQQLLRVYIDGIPLDLASKLLPVRSWINFALLSHIHLHARFQKRFAGEAVSTKQNSVRQTALLGLIDNLKTAVKKLKWRPVGTNWENYYTVSNYRPDALAHKKQLVTEMFNQITPVPQRVWDLGANTGLFSRVASDKNILTIAFDIDPAAVEKNYLESVAKDEQHILSLILDLTNPSPGLGWQNQERSSLIERGPVDVIFALALIHHLVIANNLPFEKVASFFSQLCESLIIEFVLKTDSQVQKLLVNREDIFADYTQHTFEQEFSKFFIIRSKQRITEMDRVLYFMSKRV